VRKSHLLDEIQGIAKTRGLSQKDLTETIGLGQSHVSELLRGKLSRFSTEKLISILEKLGATVEIKVRRGA
jgi:predicted XRE-type DNA-binding protein